MLKETISDFKELRMWLNDWFFCRRHSARITLAASLADMKQKAFNKRYFVMPVELPQGDRLVSINNDDFAVLKQKKWLPPKMSTLDLERQSFYQTSLTKNNRENREQRKAAREKYLRYARKFMKTRRI